MVSLVSSRTPRSFPWKEVFHLPPPPQHVLEHGAIPPREKEFFAFVELHKILLNQLVQVPLNDSKTIWCITSPPSYLLSIKLPWVHSVSSSPLLMKFLSNIHSALTPEQTISESIQAGLRTSIHNPLGPAPLIVSNPPYSLCKQPILCQVQVRNQP